MAWMDLEEDSVPKMAFQSQLIPWFSLGDPEQRTQLLWAQISNL